MPGLKPRLWQGCIPSRGSRGEPSPYFVQSLEAARIPWLMAPSSIFGASSVTFSSLTGNLTLLPPSYKDPCDYTALTR